MAKDREFGEIGKCIHSMRKARDLTLEQTAERTGLSVSYLSQIENGHVNLNLRVLRGIAAAFNVPLIDFLVTGQEQDISLVRVADRRTYTLDTGSIESLLFANDRLNLEATIMTIPPGTSSGPPNHHPGEEFTWLIRGRVRIRIGESRSVDLDPGDIIYYRSDLSHYWENPFNEEAQVLITNTPATF